MAPTPSTFQAYVFENYGDPLQEIKLRTDFPQSALRATDVRIKVHAAALNPIDYKVVDHGAKYLPTGPSAETPFRLGHDVAGTIVQVGANVKTFQVGDAVYAKTYFGSLGTFAEYIDLDTKFVALKPQSLTFNQAAGVPLASQTSYQALVNYGNIKEGNRVLILGGSSGTGAFAIQIAKALGASFVAATTSERNSELVKSFGADHIIDYTSEKWADILDAHSIDIIYDCGAEPDAWNGDAQRVLKRDTGKFVTILTTENPIESPIGAAFFKMMTNPASVDLPAITRLIDTGKIFTPIDSVHRFENLLDAIKVQMSNRARGKIILEVLPDQKRECQIGGLRGDERRVNTHVLGKRSTLSKERYAEHGITGHEPLHIGTDLDQRAGHIKTHSKRLVGRWWLGYKELTLLHKFVAEWVQCRRVDFDVHTVSREVLVLDVRAKLDIGEHIANILKDVDLEGIDVGGDDHDELSRCLRLGVRLEAV